MGGCPITCPCRRSAAGVFGLALSIWSAVFAPSLLGANFGAMLAGLLFAPHVVALPLAGWGLAVGVGLWLTISGIAPAIEEGDEGSSWLISLAAIGGGAAALGLGWHLPVAWGAFWSLGSEGLYVAAIAAGAANVGLSLAARGYEAGYIAGRVAAGGGPPIDPGPWQALVERQAREIDGLMSERDRLAGDLARKSAAAPDALLLFDDLARAPGAARKLVRRAVRTVLHPDGAKTEAERRALTERFQKSEAVFDRLGEGY